LRIPATASSNRRGALDGSQSEILSGWGFCLNLHDRNSSGGQRYIYISLRPGPGPGNLDRAATGSGNSRSINQPPNRPSHLRGGSPGYAQNLFEIGYGDFAAWRRQ
jgi:hypothetical protein